MGHTVWKRMAVLEDGKDEKKKPLPKARRFSGHLNRFIVIAKSFISLHEHVWNRDRYCPGSEGCSDHGYHWPGWLLPRRVTSI